MHECAGKVWNLLLGGVVLKGAHDALEEKQPHDGGKRRHQGNRGPEVAAPEPKRRGEGDANQPHQYKNVQNRIEHFHY